MVVSCSVRFGGRTRAADGTRHRCKLRRFGLAVRCRPFVLRALRLVLVGPDLRRCFALRLALLHPCLAALAQVLHPKRPEVKPAALLARVVPALDAPLDRDRRALRQKPRIVLGLLVEGRDRDEVAFFVQLPALVVPDLIAGDKNARSNVSDRLPMNLRGLLCLSCIALKGPAFRTIWS